MIYACGAGSRDFAAQRSKGFKIIKLLSATVYFVAHLIKYSVMGELK